jgi:hypothetical protein
MGMFDWLTGTKAKTTTNIVQDPYKTKVSSPLSSYLATQVGQGIPTYTGQLTEPLDEKAYSNYQDFLAINPDEWYTNAVVNPTMEDMKDQMSLLDEGWAGSLRGSGRFRDKEDFVADTASTLAEGRYQAELEIPQAQFEMAQSYQTAKNAEYQTEYTAWYNSLPQNNPALTQALQFLSSDSGYNIITSQTAGTQGALSTVLGMVGGVLTGKWLSSFGTKTA